MRISKRIIWKEIRIFSSISIIRQGRLYSSRLVTIKKRCYFHHSPWADQKDVWKLWYAGSLEIVQHF